jgi:hypothetical protein
MSERQLQGPEHTCVVTWARFRALRGFTVFLMESCDVVFTPHPGPPSEEPLHVIVCGSSRPGKLSQFSFTRRSSASITCASVTTSASTPSQWRGDCGVCCRRFSRSSAVSTLRRCALDRPMATAGLLARRRRGGRTLPAGRTAKAHGQGQAQERGLATWSSSTRTANCRNPIPPRHLLGCLVLLLTLGPHYPPSKLTVESPEFASLTVQICPGLFGPPGPICTSSVATVGHVTNAPGIDSTMQLCERKG